MRERSDHFWKVLCRTLTCTWRTLRTLSIVTEHVIPSAGRFLESHGSKTTTPWETMWWESHSLLWVRSRLETHRSCQKLYLRTLVNRFEKEYCLVHTIRVHLWLALIVSLTRMETLKFRMIRKVQVLLVEPRQLSSSKTPKKSQQRTLA